MVLFFNVALRLLIGLLVRMERHTTVSAELNARALYLWLVQFINVSGFSNSMLAHTR